MTMPIPTEPKIYHIVHVDRLPSIITDGWLWCDTEIVRRSPPGTTIGMNAIKQRRLNELTLNSHEVTTVLRAASHRPLVAIKPEWYY
jgi:hypothetical protein